MKLKISGYLMALIFFFAGNCYGHDLHSILLAAGNHYNISPPAVLNALAIVESNMNPLAINMSSRQNLAEVLKKKNVPHTAYTRNGRYFFSIRPRDRAQAEKLIHWGASSDHISYDVGLMQIWKGNVNHYNLDPIELLDPIPNALAGGMIFRKCLDRYKKSVWEAIECYHHGHFKGEPTYYSENVYAAIKRLVERRN